MPKIVELIEHEGRYYHKDGKEVAGSVVDIAEEIDIIKSNLKSIRNQSCIIAKNTRGEKIERIASLIDIYAGVIEARIKSIENQLTA